MIEQRIDRVTGRVNYFKANVLMLAHQQGLTMRDIGAALGCTAQAVVQALDKGRPASAYATIENLASVLGVPPATLTRRITTQEYGAAFIPRFPN
jgi:transcriptional regulator with XRE-family HTH domain